MALPTRTVTGTVYRGLSGATIKFCLMNPAIYQGTIIGQTVWTAFILADGTFSITLPCLADFDTPSRYLMFLPGLANIPENQNPPYVFNLSFGDGSNVNVSTLLV